MSSVNLSLSTFSFNVKVENFDESILEDRQFDLLPSSIAPSYEPGHSAYDDEYTLEDRQLVLLPSPIAPSDEPVHSVDNDCLDLLVTSSEDFESYFKPQNSNNLLKAYNEDEDTTVVREVGKKRDREEFESSTSSSAEVSNKKRKVDTSESSTSSSSNENPTVTLKKVQDLVNNLFNQKPDTFRNLTAEDFNALAQLKRVKDLLLS